MCFHGKVGQFVIRTLLLFSLGCRTTISNHSQSVSSNTPFNKFKTNPPWNSPETLTILESKKIALEDNPDLKELKIRIHKASSRVRQAYSTYYPQINAHFSATRIETVPIDQTFGAEGVSGENYFIGLSGSWLLFDGLAREFNVLAAKQAVLSTEESYRNIRRLLVNSISKAFYSALLEKYRMQITEADIHFNKKFLEETKIRKKYGAASRTEVLNFKLRLENAKIQLINSERNYRLGLIGLLELMGKSSANPGYDIQLIEETSTDELDYDPKFNEELIDAITHRPDIKKLVVELDRAKLLAKASYGFLLPRIALTGDIRSFRRDQFKFSNDDKGISYGLNAEWDVFAGKRKYESWKQAKEDINIAKYQLEDRWNEVLSEIKQQIENVKSGRKQLAIQLEIKKITQEIRGNVEKEYRTGTASLTRLNEVQRDLVIAEENLALTRVGLRLSKENLRAATGSNLQDLNHDGLRRNENIQEKNNVK